MWLTWMWLKGTQSRWLPPANVSNQLGSLWLHTPTVQNDWGPRPVWESWDHCCVVVVCTRRLVLPTFLKITRLSAWWSQSRILSLIVNLKFWPQSLVEQAGHCTYVILLNSHNIPVQLAIITISTLQTSVLTRKAISPYLARKHINTDKSLPP